MNNHIIVCYSHSGHNLEVAKEIQRKIGGEIIQLEDWFKTLKGGFLFFLGGMFGSLKIPSKIKPLNKEISKYSEVILLSPIWGWNITPAVRSFLKSFSTKINNLYFISVCGEGDKLKDKVLKNLTEIYKGRLVKSLFISDEEFKKHKYSEKLNQFF